MNKIILFFFFSFRRWTVCCCLAPARRGPSVSTDAVAPPTSVETVVLLAETCQTFSTPTCHRTIPQTTTTTTVKSMQTSPTATRRASTEASKPKATAGITTPRCRPTPPFRRRWRGRRERAAGSRTSLPTTRPSRSWAPRAACRRAWAPRRRPRACLPTSRGGPGRRLLPRRTLDGGWTFTSSRSCLFDGE